MEKLMYPELAEETKSGSTNQRLDAMRNQLAALSLAHLSALWMETENPQPMTTELADVRGWIMDDLEQRFPATFDNWIDCGMPEPITYFGGGK